MMSLIQRFLFLFTIVTLLLSACGTGPVSNASKATPVQASATPKMVTPPSIPPSVKSFSTGTYRDLFKEYLGKSDIEVQSRLDAAWQQLFYGDDDSQRIYYPVGEDMAYIEDIGNSDVRTEGMSYGLMISVQLDKKAEFDRLWKWAKIYMYQPDDPFKGYFAWHCTTDGKKLDSNPASDGEEWFVMALFLASARWGDGEGIFAYRTQAQEILDTMLHMEEKNSDLATNMFNTDTRQVVFVPKIGKYSNFTDPSYHLPAYYELWARWADRDNQFWTDAAQSSRDFFKKSANPQTGLMPDYANFDGTPYGTDEHRDFRFDAWRTLSNVAVDYAWFGSTPWEAEQSNRVLTFLSSQGMDSYPNQYSLEGEPLSSSHSTGLVAMAAVAAMAASPDTGKPFVQALWDSGVPSGNWRYYDGMLYMVALLHVSGHFQIYAPTSVVP